MLVFQAVEGMGADERVAIGDVLLSASGLPSAVLLRIVLTIELSERVRLGIFLMPLVKFVYALLVFVSFVCCGFRNHYAPYNANADNCTVNLQLPVFNCRSFTNTEPAEY